MEKGNATAHTLERVAELAGVSRSTVSRALHDDPHVKASTRDKILEIVERIGIRAESGGARSGLRPAGMVGIVISVDLDEVFSDPFFAALLRELYGAARDRDLVVSVWLLGREG